MLCRPSRSPDDTACSDPQPFTLFTTPLSKSTLFPVLPPSITFPIIHNIPLKMTSTDNRIKQLLQFHLPLLPKSHSSSSCRSAGRTKLSQHLDFILQFLDFVLQTYSFGQLVVFPLFDIPLFFVLFLVKHYIVVMRWVLHL